MSAAPVQATGAAAGSSAQSPAASAAAAAGARATAGPPSAATAGKSAPSAAAGASAPSAAAGASATNAGASAAAGQAASASTAAAGSGGHAGAAVTQLTLTAVDLEELSDGFVAFPESARPPTNQSPGFSWTGVPAQAESLVLVFRDVTSDTPPVKWVLWNIPPQVSAIPANVSGSAAMPPQVPGATQLGSLGNQGYAGPCCVGNEYEWTLYAMDVAELPGTARLSTAQIYMNVLDEHTIEKSKSVMMRIKD